MYSYLDHTPEYRILKEQNRDDIDWIRRKPLILREEGSGTRKEAEKQLKNVDLAMLKSKFI